ncbi:G-type lectin S-receptor-like serine/threonine-protein kinase [Capsicum chinense]|nr:G-type lectin S-receptor-like serine/threonine-protein kinase [Capsicum chinense]
MENFTKKLGEGGFGSVFEGYLEDGTKIAVKCLDRIGQVKKSFLAEVQTIDSIHHVNLVQLIRFYAEKSHRILVYEFMGNGSLEKWIYHGKQEEILDWIYRKKIIQDVAKELAYLHEKCRQNILHFDIKPPNILLDEKLNAKLSDFGLAKLIDQNQSQVMTMMRGTPDYFSLE